MCIRDSHHAHEGLERGGRMALDELIDIGKRSRHPPRQRFVPHGRLQRVDPDGLVGRPMETFHLPRQHRGIAPVQTVGQDHDDRSPGHAGHPETVIETADALSEPGSPRPVQYPLNGLAQGGIGVPGRELTSEPGEPGPDGEGFDPGDVYKRQVPRRQP